MKEISPFYSKKGKKKVEKHRTKLRNLGHSTGSISNLMRNLKQECGIKSGIFRVAQVSKKIKS